MLDNFVAVMCHVIMPYITIIVLFFQMCDVWVLNFHIITNATLSCGDHAVDHQNITHPHLLFGL